MPNRRRSQISPSQSTATYRLRLKLTRLVSRHDEMKMAYQRLKSQIRTGLLEAEEVFASLAIPLVKLVGLKTIEMAEEGRFATIVIDIDSPHERRRNGVVSESSTVSRVVSPVSEGREDQNHKLEDVNYATKATMAGKELVDKQQAQLIQLVHLLRRIEAQVNSRQSDIIRTLANHRASLNKIFQKALCSLSNLHSQNKGTYFITVKLLRAIFDYTNLIFGSVETGVDDLIEDLAKHMCNPMVEYVNDLKADMKIGTCARLLAVVYEMEIALKNGRLELEQARERIRVAEEEKTEALCKLKETDERLRRMNEHVRFPPDAKTGSRESCVPYKSAKVLGMEEDQDKDDKLLWELLKKRIYKTPESPMGPGELLLLRPSCSYHKPTRETRPLIVNRPASRSCISGLPGPQTPRKETRIPLGPSPSAVIQQSVSRKGYKSLNSCLQL